MSLFLHIHTINLDFAVVYPRGLSLDLIRLTLFFQLFYAWSISTDDWSSTLVNTAFMGWFTYANFHIKIYDEKAWNIFPIRLFLFCFKSNCFMLFCDVILKIEYLLKRYWLRNDKCVPNQMKRTQRMVKSRFLLKCFIILTLLLLHCSWNYTVMVVHKIFTGNQTLIRDRKYRAGWVLQHHSWRNCITTHTFVELIGDKKWCMKTNISYLPST